MADIKRAIIIITGGSVNDAFACDFINEYNNPYIIGADRGLLFLKNAGITPNEILGDFDSVSREEVRSFFEDESIIRHEFKSEKDETDTQLAIMRATELVCNDSGFGDVYILGALGKRLDHTLATLHGLTFSYDRGVSVYVLDTYNKIYIAPKDFHIKKDTQYGNYVSFIPLTETVCGLTLSGFKYNLSDYTLTISKSLATSNEIKEGSAHVSYGTGYLLCIESKD